MDRYKIMDVLNAQDITAKDILDLCAVVRGDIILFGNIYLYKYNNEQYIELVNAVSHSMRSENIAYLGIASNNYRDLFDNFRKMSNRQKLEWLIKVNNINVRMIKLKLKQL